MRIDERDVRHLAIGHLWDATQGRASAEAIKYFGEGAAWALKFLSNHDNAEQKGGDDALNQSNRK